MSLVNDALRRAEQSQPKSAAPAVVPPLRLAETGPHSRGPGFLPVMLIFVILLLAGFLLWQWFSGGHAETQVRAKALPAANVPAPAPVVTQPPPAPAQPAPTPEPVVTKAVAPPIAAEPPKPLPPAYKLQTVVYLPGNSSAMINGKVVFVDSRVNDARVVAIGPDRVTLVTADGQTNVLVMR